MNRKLETPPLLSAELVEYLSGIFVRDTSNDSRWLPRRLSRSALFGGEIFISTARACQLNLGPSLRKALSYYQLDGTVALYELGLSTVNELGYVGERNGAWDVPLGEPEALVESFYKGQAVMSSACRTALYHATLLAANEGLDVVPSALFFLTLALSSSTVNRVTQNALVIDEGRLFTTNSCYDDFQRRVCRVPVEEFLVPETPLSTRYPKEAVAAVNALFDGVIPEFQFPAHFVPLATLLVEQSLSPGSWEPGGWRPVSLTKDLSEISRLSKLLNRRGMLYQGFPNSSNSLPRYLSVRSEDVRYIWDNFPSE